MNSKCGKGQTALQMALEAPLHEHAELLIDSGGTELNIA